MTAQIQSPLYRARARLVSWVEALPKEFKVDVMIVLDELCSIAEREISAAWNDGYRERQQSERIDVMRQALKKAEP